MSSNERQMTLRQILDMPEVCAWIAAHEREVAAFERHLQNAAPGAWQEEFVRVVLQSVEQEERE